MQNNLVNELSLSYQADQLAKAQNAVDMMTLVEQFDGNFDILESPDAIDMFLKMLVQTYDSSVVMPTPDLVKNIEGAGVITRFESGVFHVGVDKEVELDNDLVPTYDGVEKFMGQVDAVVRGDAAPIIDIPEMTFEIKPVAKPSRRCEVEMLAEKLLEKNFVMIDPPFGIMNYCDRVGYKHYSAPLGELDLVKFGKSKKRLLGFGLTNADMEIYIKRGISVASFRFSPFFPVSSRYIHKVQYEEMGITGKYIMNRKFRSFTYEFNTYHKMVPAQWSAQLNIPISRIHIEHQTWELMLSQPLANYPYSLRSLYFPYVVCAERVGGDRGQVTSRDLTEGEYVSPDFNQKIVITRRRYFFHKMDIVSVKVKSARVISVVCNHLAMVIRFECFRGRPCNQHVFVYQGDYYYRDFNVSGFCFNYHVDVPIMVAMMNKFGSCVNEFLNLQIHDVARHYNGKQYLAYYQVAMADDIQYESNEEGGQGVIEIEQFDVGPIKF